MLVLAWLCWRSRERILHEARYVLAPSIASDQEFIFIKHPLDTMDTTIAVERLAEYVAPNTCPELLKEVEEDTNE